MFKNLFLRCTLPFQCCNIVSEVGVFPDINTWVLWGIVIQHRKLLLCYLALRQPSWSFSCSSLRLFVSFLYPETECNGVLAGNLEFVQKVVMWSIHFSWRVCTHARTHTQSNFIFSEAILDAKTLYNGTTNAILSFVCLFIRIVLY